MNDERHGPLLVPLEMIKPAGFICKYCRAPVRVVRQVVPFLVPRVCVYACDCGPGVTVWEDQSNPDAKTWARAMATAREARVDMIVFNGGRDTPPEFSGLN
jgi:hypothetical protein